VKFEALVLALLTACCSVGRLAVADKIKVEIVETTDTIRILPRLIPGAPEQMNTHCDASVAGNTASADCNTTTTPATQATSVPMPSFDHSAKAILPDGSHVTLVCFPWNKGCGVIAPLAPEKSSSHCDVTGGNTTCVTKSLGVYQAKRNKNGLVIYTPKGKVRYQITTGSW
jgi:hypothetical protein